jgi:putative ABC transport system substrate-binding protein
VTARTCLVFLLLTTALAAEPTGPELGILWSSKSSMADRVYAGMAQVLQAKAPQIRIEVRPALRDDTAAALVYAEWQATKQGIVVLRSAGARLLVEKPPRIPCFIGAANSPVELGLMQDLNRPDGLVTGVTYYLPYHQHLDAFRLIWPDLRKIGLLLQQGHPSTPIDEKGTIEAGNALGIITIVQRCSAKNDLATATKALQDAGAQVIIIGNQNLIFDNATLVSQSAGKIPVLSFSDKPIAAKQVVGGLGVDDFYLGQKLGEAVIAVLVDRKPVAEIPVATDPAPRLRLVMERVRALGIQVPLSVLNQVVKVE